MTKNDAALARSLEQARAAANAHIDAAAEKEARDAPGVPVNVIRQMTVARAHCPCACALLLLAEGK